MGGVAAFGIELDSGNAELASALRGSVAAKKRVAEKAGDQPAQKREPRNNGRASHAPFNPLDHHRRFRQRLVPEV